MTQIAMARLKRNVQLFRDPIRAIGSTVVAVSIIGWELSATAACPEEWPHMEACIELSTSCGDATGWESCEAITDVSIWDGWYGCQASPHRHQCLLGNAAAQTTCYIECICYVNWWDAEEPFCEKDNRDCARHYRVPKQTVDCPPEG